MANPALSLLMLSVSALFIQGAWSATFTFLNKCHYTVWPGLLSGAASGQLPTTGFRLKPGTTRIVEAPANWSGRMWPRTHCGRQCNNAGGAPPVTLAEFTLQGDGGKDFYDVSNVDGFNVPISITPLGKPGCPSTTCKTNINSVCPRALQTKLPNGKVVGCKSACLAFGTDQYCCTGSYANPNTCKSTVYSSVFKKACPQAYSYAYDDGTSTFTCVGANYLITFCP
ncbi:thaumatin-like protein 1 [Carex littledalei]|uniref:Thaumatin-like protein 1 n=1 Tax=Carex littledalei TaxID=544730 RepID=A0A833VI11_9POAL|nr:thaumatin-like protein 1 [Carex littledalei]